MKKLQAILLSGCLVFLFSCQSTIEKQGDFKLLPLPQLFEIRGSSALKYNDILHYIENTEIDLPVRGELLINIQPS